MCRGCLECGEDSGLWVVGIVVSAVATSLNALRVVELGATCSEKGVKS